MKNTLAGFNILIVEDDPILRELICDVLKESGATVFEAANGLLGFQIIEKEKIDFVLSDIQMPVMDGVELLKKIRAVDATFPLVLFMTGQCNITAEDAIASGASGLLNKPFKLSEVIGRVEQLLATSKAS